MKALVFDQPGGPDVFHLANVPDLSPGVGEVLIDVKALGVNFADHLMRIGAYPIQPPPFIAGLECAGRVSACGPDVTGLVPGQPVIAWGRRTYAEQMVAYRWAVSPSPKGFSFEEAAAIPVAFGTAWHALVVLAGVQPGERVLVHAAGSGVGSAAIQVAKQLGAWVVATAGQDWKLARAQDLGADAVVNYETQDFAEEITRLTDGAGVHVVLEGVGRATFPKSLRVLGEAGRMVIYGSPSGARVELDTREAIARNLTLFGMSIVTGPLFESTVASFQKEAIPWFESGRLKPVIDKVYPLAQAGEAHQRMMDRALFGKLVLTV